MYDQMYEYFNKILSKLQSQVRQGFSTQHCLLIMTEKWRKHLDKDGVNGALLTNMSRAVYGFDYESLTLIQSYLLNRKQRTKDLIIFPAPFLI